MLGADEDGSMLFLHNKFLLYIFKCKWNRETGLIGCRMANILNCRATYLKAVGKIIKKPSTSEYWWIVPIKKFRKS